MEFFFQNIEEKKNNCARAWFPCPNWIDAWLEPFNVTFCIFWLKTRSSWFFISTPCWFDHFSIANSGIIQKNRGLRSCRKARKKSKTITAWKRMWLVNLRQSPIKTAFLSTCGEIFLERYWDSKLARFLNWMISAN